MVRDQLQSMLEPIVTGLGFELWELEFAGGSHGGVLRLYIEKPRTHIDEVLPDGGSAITVDDCERVSRAVSATLDKSDPIPGEYTLEVSSPGLDRVLRTAGHFERYQGEIVKLETKELIGGRRKFAGRLLQVADEAVTLDVGGSPVRLPLQSIHKARLVPTI